MGVYDYEKIVSIYEVVMNLISNNSTAATDTTLLGYYSSLSSTVNLVANRQSANKFYSPMWELYSIYYNVLINGGAKDYLESTYSIDVDELNQDENITTAMSVLKTEISTLTSNTQAFSEKTTLLKVMNQLYTTYQNYLSGSVTYSDVTSMRNYLKTTETSVLSGTVGDYSTMIDNVNSRLKAKDVSSDTAKTALKTQILTQLNSYYLKNDYYDENNYLVINSKVTNIVSELTYLKSIEDELTVDIGITIDW